ncbi:hypothetical protein GQR58_018655 [Nymphon striatum]|nr:hypothetical protein GQR58_018655 [Nymphon striatum]
MQHLQFKLLMKQLEASELLPRCHHVVVSLSPRDQYVYITFSLSCPYVVTQSIFKTDFGQISKCPLHSFSDFTTERMKLNIIESQNTKSLDYLIPSLLLFCLRIYTFVKPKPRLNKLSKCQKNCSWWGCV